MKKLITLGLISAAALLFIGAGCNTQSDASSEQMNNNTAHGNQELEDSLQKDSGDAVENEEDKSDNKAVPGVTEEDLNNLKAEIDKMDYEDLNALSQ